MFFPWRKEYFIRELDGLEETSCWLMATTYTREASIFVKWKIRLQNSQSAGCEETTMRVHKQRVGDGSISNIVCRSKGKGSFSLSTSILLALSSNQTKSTKALTYALSIVWSQSNHKWIYKSALYPQILKCERWASPSWWKMVLWTRSRTLKVSFFVFLWFFL